MHTHSVENWAHEHVFLGARHDRNERRSWIVVAVTAVMMVAEIVAGTVFGSMALLADGWHMATHAAAIGIAAVAYRLARRHARDPRFTFGTGKLGELAGFSSALLLGLVALLIAYESTVRLLAPVAIQFTEALLVAGLGLAVNLASAWLLFDSGEPHAHAHSHADHHGHDHAHDSNIRAAYAHVLADALTSVLAIAALVAGRYLGWIWLDPVIGIVGAVVILRWSWTLIVSASGVLLDMVPDKNLPEEIRKRLETDGDRVTDLHLWRVGPGHMAAVVAVVSDHAGSSTAYKERLRDLPALSHVTVEVQACGGHGCKPD
jgi:cation diffusion facilitator family transporter